MGAYCYECGALAPMHHTWCKQLGKPINEGGQDAATLMGRGADAGEVTSADPVPPSPAAPAPDADSVERVAVWLQEWSDKEFEDGVAAGMKEKSLGYIAARLLRAQAAQIATLHEDFQFQAGLTHALLPYQERAVRAEVERDDISKRLAGLEQYRERDQLAQRVIRAEAERERLRADAERYRWLRDHRHENWYAKTYLLHGEKFDAFIDAARGET